MSFSKSLVKPFLPSFNSYQTFIKRHSCPTHLFALPYVKSKTPIQTSLYDRIT